MAPRREEPEREEGEGQSDPGATNEREQEESLQRVERGGIPIAAERRLRELGGADGGAGAFTSDLSVGSFALCHELGLKPLAQVMGSSIYQVGYASNMAMYGGRSFMFELDALSQAWNEVRDRAFARIAQEAELLGADAVVGVQIDAGAREYSEGAIECIVVGTAVKRSDSRRAASAAPIITELSVPDFAKLHRAGIGTLGVVAWTSVFFVNAWGGGGRFGPGASFGGVNFMQNQELTGFTQGVYEARESVMRRIGQQASRLGASGIVGMRIGHNVRPMDLGGGQYQQRGLMVSFDAIGTAVETGDGRQIAAPETILDLSEEGAIQT